MQYIETEERLEDRLSTPNGRDIAVAQRLSGDVIVLGAGGKMGPSLARRIKRAVDAAGTRCRVIAVSRFSAPGERESLEATGVETIACDLLDRDAVAQLLECENVFFLAGRKFGSSDRTDLTWAMNTVVPANVAHRYRASRIVVFSTGNVYPFVSPSGARISGGSIESDAVDPRGEYAQSCLGRERVFEYFSHEFGTPALLFRLNYAVDLRYGTLVDIARKVYESQPVDLTVAHFNTIWQGDANSYAIRCLELCQSPPRVLNVTGLEIISVRETAEFYARRFGRAVTFRDEDSGVALLNNATRCHELLGQPEMSLGELMELVARWIECGGRSLNKPTKFEVVDGKF
ncbi:MAG: NAD-dependent epimerase/dehydratase family protein [Blastocatellia bacterium]